MEIMKDGMIVIFFLIVFFESSFLSTRSLKLQCSLLNSGYKLSLEDTDPI